MRAIARSAILALIATIAGCADLPTLPRATCGNGILEPDQLEECDGFPQGGCGVPGTPAACRFTCSTGQSTVDCPTGYACGGDGICRQPSGQFTFVSRPSAVPGYSLQQGDFDGDGRADLVSRGGDAVVVHFGDEASPFTVSWMLEPATPVAVTNLSSDALSDLIHISDIGISVLRGTASRTFLPTPYSSMPVPSATATMLAFDARPRSQSPSSWTGFQFEGDEVVSMALRSLDVRWPENSPLFQLPVGLGEIKALPAVGNLLEDPIASPCQELAVIAGNTVQVLTPCVRQPQDGSYTWNHDINTLEALKLEAFELPLGESPRLELFDMNRDGHLDVVVVSDMALLIGYGLGDGRFHSSADELKNPALIPDQTAKYSGGKYGGASGLLAFGHLNDDDIPDLVTMYSIELSTGVVSDSVAEYQTAVFGDGTWSEAIVADLNGNGLDDVLIASSGRPDFAFFNNAGDGKLNQFEVRTGGLPTMLKKGDFDGDLLADVIFRERKAVQTGGQASSTFIDSLSIAFGKPFGAPEAPVSAGELGQIMQIVPGNVGATYQDAITDVMVLNQAASASSPSIAIFPGASSRQLQSPLRLELTGSSRVVPTQVVAGQFDGDSTGHADLAVLASLESVDSSGVGGAMRLWLLPSTGDAALDPATFGMSEALSDELIPWSLLMTTADLDSDGTDEVIVLGQTWSMEGAAVVLRARKDGAKSIFAADPILKTAELFSSDALVGGGGGKVDGNLGTEPAGGVGNEMMMLGSAVKAADIDGDGLTDLAATGTFYPTSGADPLGMVEQRLVIMRNDGSGKLDVAGKLSLKAPGGRQVSGFTFAQLDLDPEQELVLLTFDAAWAVDVDLAGNKAHEPRQLEGVTGGDDATSIDFDSDGVQDLVIGKGDGLFLYRGAPVR